MIPKKFSLGRRRRGPLLRGATERGPEGMESADAGQFAAMWNALTPEQREDVFRGIRLTQRDEALQRQTVRRWAGYVRDVDGVLDALVHDLQWALERQAPHEVREGVAIAQDRLRRGRALMVSDAQALDDSLGATAELRSWLADQERRRESLAAYERRGRA